MMMVFVANCVATILVIYPSVALAMMCASYAPAYLYLTRLSGLFIETLEHQFERSFVVILWALLLRCAIRQVIGNLG